MADKATQWWRTQSWLQIAEHAIALTAVLYTGKQIHDKGVRAALETAALRIVKAVPGGAAMVEAEQKKIVEKIEEFALGGTQDDPLKHYALPANGIAHNDIKEVLASWRDKEEKYRSGKSMGGKA
tara:strand:- start:117 stop:491 length:375 start_codon:yes stop_codon:yes gene_type:complete